MRIEAVTVCVDYPDFLAESAKWNLPHFDSWTIVTSPRDEATRELCRKLNLRCIVSDDGHRFGKPFAKGRLIERALQHASADGWRLHIDADTVLPHCFRHRLQAADLQEDHIYGVDRLMLHSWEQWQALIASGYLQGGQYDYHCKTSIPPGVTVGTRWAHPQMGYVPIGYFQLWHSSQDEWRGVRVRPYPLNHGDACRTDVQHALQWDRHKRALIPELYVVHLESEKAQRGANWSGRTTQQFGPAQTLDKKPPYGPHHHHHHHHHHKGPKK